MDERKKEIEREKKGNFDAKETDKKKNQMEEKR